MNSENNLKELWMKSMGCDLNISEEPINRLERISSYEGPISSEQLAQNCKSLEELSKMVHDFDECLLKKGAINTVFADGNPNSQIMFIGKAPGATEDATGKPFCGQSGKLLDNIILAMGYKREDVYITNTVFWRPPGNRRPTSEEIKMLRPFVEKHVALIKPKLLVLVGNTAVESLLDLKSSMHSIRGQYFDYTNKYMDSSIKGVVIFHPSYLLRQQSKKKEMWKDVQKIKSDFLV